MIDKNTVLALNLLMPAIVSTGCSLSQSHQGSVADLDQSYHKIAANIDQYKEGGRIVLDTAYKVLREGKAQGKWPLVGIEDLWAESIKEGSVLFNDPNRRWGKTTAAETKDMIGQTTIGPWQITITNVKNIYGLPYGIKSDWSNEKVYAYCRDNPEIQAKMISDYIQEAYTKYGRRGPYGIQRYFWLEAYVRGWIGQGQWDKSVLPTPPDGDWKKLTPQMKADTGFYAKQLLLGWERGRAQGLLYWLWVTGDEKGIRDVLRTWRDQKKMVWDNAKGDAVLTDDPGGFGITKDDLKHMAVYPKCYANLKRIVTEVAAE